MGLAGVAFGSAGPLSYGGILGHHWGEDGFSLSTIQPIVFYNTELFAKRVAPQLTGLFEDEWENRWWPTPMPVEERARPREVVG